MTPDMERSILDLIEDHRILTLATVREDGYPQATTVIYANEGLKLYFPTGRDSQKIQNIHRCDKVSLTIDRDYEDWSRIKGLSMAARAEVVADPALAKHAMGLLLKKFPQMASLAEEVKPEEVAIVKLTPRVISVIDYELGFGHTDLLEVESP
jgi:nitroimidazol reductase NimA-like FMN-containing flavoprotein (pyridoxamine 5'-phosphate oxidase superfamily)